MIDTEEFNYGSYSRRLLLKSSSTKTQDEKSNKSNAHPIMPNRLQSLPAKYFPCAGGQLLSAVQTLQERVYLPLASHLWGARSRCKRWVIKMDANQDVLKKKRKKVVWNWKMFSRQFECCLWINKTFKISID